jgi:putative redox protein
METAHTIYLGDLRTKVVHILSGSELITDAPPDNQGKGEAFSPTDLASVSLASCMLTIMGIAARNHGFNIDGTEVSITKIMASNPRRIGEIQVEFFFPDVVYSDKERAIIERSALTCPVYLSLHPELVKTVKFNFKD